MDENWFRMYRSMPTPLPGPYNNNATRPASNQASLPINDHGGFEGYDTSMLSAYHFHKDFRPGLDAIDTVTGCQFSSMGCPSFVGFTQQNSNASLPVWQTADVTDNFARSRNLPAATVLDPTTATESVRTIISVPAPAVLQLQEQTSQPAPKWPTARNRQSSRVYCLACRRSLQYKPSKIAIHLNTTQHWMKAERYPQPSDSAPLPDEQIPGGRLISLVRPDEPHIWWIAEGKGL